MGGDRSSCGDEQAERTRTMGVGHTRRRTDDREALMTDSRTCPHQAANVHGLVGSGPVAVSPSESRLDLSPVEWGHLAAPLRPGEQMSAAIGECSTCGALVVSVATWNPSDGRGENSVQHQSRWVPLFSTYDQDTPTPADPSARHRAHK